MRQEARKSLGHIGDMTSMLRTFASSFAFPPVSSRRHAGQVRAKNGRRWCSSSGGALCHPILTFGGVWEGPTSNAPVRAWAASEVVRRRNGSGQHRETKWILPLNVTLGRCKLRAVWIGQGHIDFWTLATWRPCSLGRQAILQCAPLFKVGHWSIIQRHQHQLDAALGVSTQMLRP